MPEPAPAGRAADSVPAPTGRRRAVQREIDAPSLAASRAGRHRAPAIPAASVVEAVEVVLEAVVDAFTEPTPEPAPELGARPRGHRRAAPKRKIPVAVPAMAGAAAVAVTAVGGVTMTGGGPGSASLESVAGAGSTTDLQRVVVSDRATRGEARGAINAQAADQARARATALRDARLAVAAAARLAALQRACGYNPNAQRDEGFTSEMTRNARIIIDVSQRMNLPPRAAVIAIATALQESYLKNMTGGHLDSAGLFQQRPSAGWGSYAQVTNPEYAARKFYTEMLEDVGSAWTRLPVTVVAQDVQVSAFPWAYARWEGMAAEIVSRVLNVPVDSLNCTPR